LHHDLKLLKRDLTIIVLIALAHKRAPDIIARIGP
jgi:hypothetical protein